MKPLILTCSSLKDYVDAAQKEAGTGYPVRVIDRMHHSEPENMKKVVGEEIENLPPGYDTVLVAMGFCGGVWDHVSYDRRIVIPRVDDCVSLLLHTDDEYHPNLKEPGHLYLYENDPEQFSAIGLMYDCVKNDETYYGLDQETLFGYWFGQYRYMDIIDTGLNDCYEEYYVEKAQENADRINAELCFTEGSYMLIKKLITGKWDEQFIVAEPGKLIRHGDFF